MKWYKLREEQSEKMHKLTRLMFNSRKRMKAHLRLDSYFSGQMVTMAHKMEQVCDFAYIEEK